MYPKLRFKGFDDAWEQRKLKEIACKVKNKNKENAISETFTNSAEFGIISQKEFFDHEVASKTNLDSYYIVDIDDFVYNPRISVTAPVGPINRNKLGKAGVMSPLYTVFKTQGVSIDFLEHYFKSTNWHSYMYLNGDSGARSDRFSIKDDVFFDMPIMVPCIKEQMQIGLLFNAISKNITLHQRQCEALKKQKQFFLQNMFPKEGESVPRIRFNGFTEPWEQRKFGDMTIRESKTGESSKNLPCVEYEDVVCDNGVLNKDLSLKDAIKKGILFDGSQVLYGKLRPYLHNWLLPDFKGVAVGDWWVLRPKGVDKKFIYRLIQTQQFDDVTNLSSGSKMPRADWKLVSNTEFAIPCSTEEQMKIGLYFEHLDNLITLHQRQYEQLVSLKKYLLSKMFI